MDSEMIKYNVPIHAFTTTISTSVLKGDGGPHIPVLNHSNYGYKSQLYC